MYLDNSRTHHACHSISSSWRVRGKNTIKLTLQQFVFNKLKSNEQITYLTVISQYYLYLTVSDDARLIRTLLYTKLLKYQ